MSWSVCSFQSCALPRVSLRLYAFTGHTACILSLFGSKKVLIVKCVFAGAGRDCEGGLRGTPRLKRWPRKRGNSFGPQEHRRQIEEVFC